MMRPSVIPAMLLLALTPCVAATVVIDDFTSTNAWSLNADGGVESRWTLDGEVYRSEPAGMRVVYTNAPPQWSNLTRAITIPPETTTLTLWLYVHRAQDAAAMHVWLMEADNDAWVARVLDGGRIVGAMAPGWHEIKIPVAEFRFEARGPGTPDMTSVDRMLLGANFADLEVTIDDLALITRDAPEGAEIMPVPQAVLYAEGPRGNVMLLRDDMPITPGCSDPLTVGQTLADAGFGVTYVTADQLAAPGVLAPERVDALVLLYGPAFPAAAVEPLRAYLKVGGTVFCSGGYAFDEPLTRVDGEWRTVGAGLTAAEVSSGGVVPAAQINTRMGRTGDTMQFEPDQIQVFDPGFLLRRVKGIRAAADQFVVPEGFEAELAVEGYSAVSTIGSHSPVFPWIYGRRIPLVQAFDGYGRLRGTVGALVRHYAGPYEGASFAIFGVTNVDLFAENDGVLTDALPGVMDALINPVYIKRLATSEACYYDGETIIVNAELAADRAIEGAELILRIGDRAEVRTGNVLAGGPPEEAISAQVAMESIDDEFTIVEAELRVAGEIVDRATTAFCVWNEDAIARGPAIEMDGQYFAINGRRAVLQGTNQTGFMWFSEHEGPLVWDRDFSAMRDNGVNILRILHFSPFSEGGYEGRPTNQVASLVHRPDKLVRQTDAIVQLAQRHGVVIFLSLHDWLGVSLSDEEYALQRDWNEFWCARYAGVPGVIYDIQNEPNIGDPPDIPDLRRLYNELLAERYGSTEAVAEAWGMDPGGELPSIAVRTGGDAWDDVVAHDYWLFKMAVYNKWVRENADGIRSGDPGQPLTVGHVISNIHADKQVGAEHVDFTNTHFYGSHRQFSQILKFSDRRWEGKPLSVGEFGTQEAHGHRNAGGDGSRDEESIRRFLWYGHYTLGLGGSFLCNWSWKDFEGAVFPWGIRYLQDDVNKDVLSAYRAQALLFRRLEPVYEAPALYVVQPDSLRFGPSFMAVEEGMRRAFTALYHAGVPFGLMGEFDLHAIPESARALIWPVPYCPSDSAFEAVETFVRNGGHVLITGDIGFDALRRPTRADRLAALGLPDVPHEGPDGATGGQAHDCVVSEVGRGRVSFVPFPLELRGDDAQISAQYTAFLDRAGADRPTPCPPPGQVLRQPLAGGGHADVFAHFAEFGDPVHVASSEFSMELEPLCVGLTAVDADGELVAFHAPGALATADGRPVVSGEVQIMACSLTDEDLPTTNQALLAPVNAGTTTLDIMAGVAEAELRIGDVVDGVFVARETRRLQRGAGGFTIDVDEDAALSLMILARPGTIDEAEETLRSWIEL